MKFKKQLIAALRKAGYDGDITDIAKVESFCKDEGIQFEMGGKSIKDVLSEADTKIAITGDEPTKQAKTISIDAANDAGEDGTAPEGAITRKALTPKNLARMATRKRYDVLAAQGKTKFATADEAETVAAGLRLNIASSWKDQSYPQRDADLDIVGKAVMTTTTATAGQSFIPDEFDPAVIRLVNQYAANRQVASYRTMMRDTYVTNKRLTGLTVYYPGEGVATTESQPSYTPLSMTAKSGHTLSRVSNELFQASAVNVADELAQEIGLAWGYDEENKFINGDGTSTYHNFTGWVKKFQAVGLTAATNTNVVDGPAGGTWAALTQDTFLAALGTVPEYARKGGGMGVKWGMSRIFYYSVALREAYGLSGDAVQRFITQGGDQNPMLLGYPVVFFETMPVATAVSQLCCFVGNFDLGCIQGQVNGSFNVVSSDQRYFESADIGIRSDRRWALNVHSAGSTPPVSVTNQAGPVVAICTPAS